MSLFLTVTSFFTSLVLLTTRLRRFTSKADMVNRECRLNLMRYIQHLFLGLNSSAAVIIIISVEAMVSFVLPKNWLCTQSAYRVSCLFGNCDREVVASSIRIDQLNRFEISIHAVMFLNPHC